MKNLKNAATSQNQNQTKFESFLRLEEFFPCKADKTPKIKWADKRNRIAYSDVKSQLVGFALPKDPIGKGYLACLDFDLKKNFKGMRHNPEPVKEWLRGQGVSSFTLLETGSGGFHAYFLTKDLIKFQPKISFKSENGLEIFDHIELRNGSTNHYNIVYNVIHEEGDFYKAIDIDFSPAKSEKKKGKASAPAYERNELSKLKDGGAGCKVLGYGFTSGESNEYRLAHVRKAQERAVDFETAIADFLASDRGSNLCKNRSMAISSYAKAWEAWTPKVLEGNFPQNLELTAGDETLDQCFLDYQLRHKQTLILSKTGTGKTTHLKNLAETSGGKVVGLVHLRSNRENIQRHGVDAFTAKKIVKKSYLLERYQILAIDEISLLFGSLGDNFYIESEKQQFLNLLKNFKGRVVLYDQKASVDLVERIKEIFPELHIVENVYTPQRRGVLYEESTKAIYDSIVWRMGRDKTAIYCDTVKQARAIYRLAKTNKVKTLFVTAETAEAKNKLGEAIREVERDPSKIEKYQCVIFTPRWQRGVSFDIDEGRHVFAIRRDRNQDAGSIAQAIDRFRKPASITACLTAMASSRHVRWTLEEFQAIGWWRYSAHVQELRRKREDDGGPIGEMSREDSDFFHAIKYEKEKALSNAWLDFKLSMKSNGYTVENLKEAEISLGSDGRPIEADIVTREDKRIEQALKLNSGQIIDDDERDYLLEKEPHERTEQQKANMLATRELKRAGANEIQDYISIASTIEKRGKRRADFKFWKEGTEHLQDPLFAKSHAEYKRLFRKYFGDGKTAETLESLRISREEADRIGAELWENRGEFEEAGLNLYGQKEHVERGEYMRLVSFVFRKLTGLKFKETGSHRERVYVVDIDDWEIMEKCLLPHRGTDSVGAKIQFYCPKALEKRIAKRDAELSAALRRFYKELGREPTQSPQLL